VKALFLFAVVQNHIKTSRKCNDELVQILVCVAATFCSARNVVKIINTPDFKRNMPPAFDKSEIASWIADFRQVNNPAFGQTHELGFSSLHFLLVSPDAGFVIGILL